MTAADTVARAARRLQAVLPVTPPTAIWPVWAGFAALALAVVLALGPAARWRAQAEAHLAELQRQTRAPLAAGRPEAGTATLPATAASEWPEPTASPRRARVLGTLASRQGMKVLQTREQLDVTGHLQITQSGQATYPALRAFVERALATDAALALDRLRLQRSEPAGAEVAFELQWTLLHQPKARVVSTTAPSAGGPR